MIDVLVDEQAEETFEPPPRIAEAVLSACAAAGFAEQEPELCIRFATDQAVHELNREFRGYDKVTDVLSFPAQQPPCDLSEPLGDVALAVPFIVCESERLGLPASDHCLHLIIHATLHLLGFDHLKDNEAAEMQQLEQQAMQAMGLHDPYPTEHS